MCEKGNFKRLEDTGAVTEDMDVFGDLLMESSRQGYLISVLQSMGLLPRDTAG